MKCDWNSFLGILPLNMRREVDALGRTSLQELRLRLHQQPELIADDKAIRLNMSVSTQELSFIVNAASKYSPWAAATAVKGYITAAGGHRIGMCGETVWDQGAIKGIRVPTSLCIRVARDFPGIAAEAACIKGNILILGPPGSGKTTLLRDLIRQKSDKDTCSVGVVDERGELFPVTERGHCFETGKHTDIISGCSKSAGIDILLRTMGPGCIAVDEITAQQDCDALLGAGWCGVSLLATAHASSVQDLLFREVYKPLVRCGLFETALVMNRDKTFRKERIQ